MVAAMPLQNDARPSEKTVTLRDLRRVAFGLSAAIMIVMIAGAINDDSGSSTATAELSEKQVANYVFTIDAGQSNAIAERFNCCDHDGPHGVNYRWSGYWVFNC